MRSEPACGEVDVPARSDPIHANLFAALIRKVSVLDLSVREADRNRVKFFRI